MTLLIKPKVRREIEDRRSWISDEIRARMLLWLKTNTLTTIGRLKKAHDAFSKWIPNSKQGSLALTHTHSLIYTHMLTHIHTGVLIFTENLRRDRKPEQVSFLLYQDLDDDEIRNGLWSMVVLSVDIGATLLPGATTSHHGLLEIVIQVSKKNAYFRMLITNLKMLITNLQMYLTSSNMQLIYFLK
jgi:hypothetical protein